MIGVKEKQIVERLAQAISDAGLSFVELEKRTGIPKSSIQRYATGKTIKIPMNCITLIASATGVSPKWIMGWETKKEEEDYTLSDDISELINLLASAPENVKKTAIAAAIAVLTTADKSE